MLKLGFIASTSKKHKYILRLYKKKKLHFFFHVTLNKTVYIFLTTRVLKKLMS